MVEKNLVILKNFIFAVLLLSVCALSACGQQPDIGNSETEIQEDSSEKGTPEDNANNKPEEPQPLENDFAEDSKTDDLDDLIEMFGENCIAAQTFEVELSEYSGKVYFVPFAPSADNPDFSVQIIQDGKVLTDLYAYVPDSLTGEPFRSLDAVSFYDVNYDGCTDIVLIETYGSTSFAAIYYGFAADADEYERYFLSQAQLSENITSQVQPLTIPEIRSFLTYGKKNGEFVSYQEAYKTVNRLCGLEDSAEKEYDLIYFDDDDIPEMVAGLNGYYMSLYTYHDGTVYVLMDHWAYGAMGNAGYEYSPRKNSLRNYNSDFAGAILYTTYMAIGEQHSMDMVAQIETYYFDDANGNGIPDVGELESDDSYCVNYMDGMEVTDEICASYDVCEYEYIMGAMNLEDFLRRLGNGD